MSENISDEMLKAFTAMGEKTSKFTDAMRKTTIVGKAGTASMGEVAVTMTIMTFEVVKVDISPKLFESSSSSMLEDLVATAFNNAKNTAQSALQEGMVKLNENNPFMNDLLAGKFGNIGDNK